MIEGASTVKKVQLAQGQSHSFETPKLAVSYHRKLPIDCQLSAFHRFRKLSSLSYDLCLMRNSTSLELRHNVEHVEYWIAAWS